MLKIDEMENDIYRYDSLNSILPFDEDDEGYLVPYNYKDSVKESKMGECDFLTPQRSPALSAKKMSMNKYFSKDSIFLSDDENDDIEYVNNESNSPSPHQSFTSEDQQKLDLPMFDEEEGKQSKTSKNKVENIKIDCETDEINNETTVLPTRSKHQKKICTRAFNFAKEVYRELRSVVSPDMKRDRECPLLLVSTFRVPDGCANVSSITKYDNGQCWVAADHSEGILLYDKDGNLVDFVNVGCRVDSLTTDRYGNVFMSCPDLKQVQVVDRNRHVTTFLNMSKYPRGIAYMETSESIIVCRNNKKDANDLAAAAATNSVKKYGIYEPNIREEIDAQFGCPLQVCVNVNDDCVISDFANCSIIVINPRGKTRFSFKPSKDFPILNIHSICCDTGGNIYIFSNGTPNVCILEPDGNLRDMLSCPDLYNEIVFAAVFDTDGYLWLGCLDGSIKIFELIPIK